MEIIEIITSCFEIRDLSVLSNNTHHQNTSALCRLIVVFELMIYNFQ